jgi:hypothetical protein
MPQAQLQLQPIASTEDLAKALAKNYTSQQQEEKLKNASMMNQRIMAIGDAVRHIGNIANTVGYAPSQQFSNPVAEEQARYERGKALRDKANLTYLTYQQQKAAQDAKAKQWEAEQSYRQTQTQLAAERLKLQRELAAARQASDAARILEIEARIKRINELLPGEKKLQNARINQANASAASSSSSAALNKEKMEHPERFRSGVGGYRTEKRRIVTKSDPITGRPVEWKDVTVRVPDKSDVNDDEFGMFVVGGDDEFEQYLEQQ